MGVAEVHDLMVVFVRRGGGPDIDHMPLLASIVRARSVHGHSSSFMEKYIKMEVY